MTYHVLPLVFREFIIMARILFASVLALGLAAGSLVAQTTTASIVGTVRDASGAIVPKASIKARALATNQTREVTTDEDGNYIFINLPIGAYDVTVSASGFKTEVNEGVVLQVSQRAHLDVTLQTGSVNESVNV